MEKKGPRGGWVNASGKTQQARSIKEMKIWHRPCRCVKKQRQIQILFTDNPQRILYIKINTFIVL